MISAVVFIVAGVVVLVGPFTNYQRRHSRKVDEGIWVERSSEKEEAQAV